MAVVFEGGAGLAAVGLGWLFGLSPAERIQWCFAGAARGLLAALPTLAIFWLTLRFPVGPLREIRRVVEEMLMPLFRACHVAELALISALAGLGEEMLFRGVIQTVVADWTGGTWGRWIGLVVASLLFGAAHPITSAYIVLAALMGAYLGWLWIESQNLLVPITAHATYDFLALVYLAKVAGRGK